MAAQQLKMVNVHVKSDGQDDVALNLYESFISECFEVFGVFIFM